MTRNLEQIAADVRAQSAEVNKLEQERAALPAAISAAAAVADAKKMVKLQQRGDELPMHINAARVRLKGLEIEQLAAELPELRAAIEPLGKLVAEAQARFEGAQKALQDATYEWQDAMEAERSQRAEIASAKREIESLIREKRPKLGPVVRSAWQGV